MNEVTSAAFGRVNLIGEHTDYNKGFVLPTAIHQKTEVHLRVRPDRVVKAYSANFDETFEYVLGEEKKRDHWADYLQGMTSLLMGDGYAIEGFELSITSDVPIGSGLSSSAAFGVSLCRALRDAFSLSLDDVAIAKLHQRVENEFVGARVGIMDPMATSLASWGEALFIDTNDLSYRRIPLGLDEVDLVVIYSGVSHRNVGGGYNLRRSECEEACRILGIDDLRELDVGDLDKVSSLPDPLSRRARHVITENARVLKAIEAIEGRDWNTLGLLFAQSHASMRDDYEVSIPEIDTLVEIADAHEDVYGCRLTGGGFGGSVVLIAKKGTGRKAAKAILSEYGSRTGESGKILMS